MPDRKTHFSEAENNKYDVSNVLNVMNDGSSYRLHKAETAESQEDAQATNADYEESTPLSDDYIDPEATIGEYMQFHENETKKRRVNEENFYAEDVDKSSEAYYEEYDEDENPYVYRETESNVKSQVIREQAEKARYPFFDDLRSVDSEPAIQRMKERTLNDKVDDGNGSIEEKEDTPSPARRIRKPRFVKTAPNDADEEENTYVHPEEDADNEKIVEEGDKQNIEEETTQTDEEYTESFENVDEEEPVLDELTQARAAQHNSICQDLHDLQKYLEEARSPMLHKSEVLVPREKTLRLIRSLTVLCDVDPSYIDGASEDMLIDRLACDPAHGEYEPLKRARCRAQTIIENANKQAETIITDAKVLATQLLAETEAEIKEKYDDADMQIAVRMDTAKEESSKKLNEARSELTASRQHSVEILSKYLEKAEIDYHGYWERAENTIMASLEQSESILTKAAEIYRKELDVIRQDRDELAEILDNLKRYRPLS